MNFVNGFAIGVVATLGVTYVFLRWGVRRLIRTGRLTGELDGKKFEA